MNTFSVLLKKELLESWRDKRLIWLPVALSILAIMQPLTLYYMPLIIEKTGGLPDGTIIEMPMPSGGEVLVSILSQFNLIGIAIIVLAMMGTIVAEKRSGALSLVLIRPVSTFSYMMSKWTVHFLIVCFSVAIAYIFGCYYTDILFDSPPLGDVVGGLLIYLLWIGIVVSIVICFSAILKSGVAVALASIGGIAVLSVATSALPNYLQWSPANVMNEAAHVLQLGSVGTGLIGVLIVSIGCMICLIYLSVLMFRRVL